MTKEDLAKKYVPCRCDTIYTSRGLTAPDCPFHTTDPEFAMEEWARQQSIAFDKWKIENKWIPNWHMSDSEYYQWIGDSGIECNVKSTDQLYELFIEYQINNK